MVCKFAFDDDAKVARLKNYIGPAFCHGTQIVSPSAVTPKRETRTASRVLTASSRFRRRATCPAKVVAAGLIKLRSAASADPRDQSAGSEAARFRAPPAPRQRGCRRRFAG